MKQPQIFILLFGITTGLSFLASGLDRIGLIVLASIWALGYIEELKEL